MRGFRPLQEALIARLEARLPDALLAKMGEYPDTSLPAPRSYTRHAPREVAEYPAVYVLPGEATTREQTGEWLTSVRELLVIIDHRDQDQARLADALTLYEPALMEAVLGKHAPPPAHGIRWVRTLPGPVFELEGENNPWQSWMQLTFEMTMYEEDRVS